MYRVRVVRDIVRVRLIPIHIKMSENQVTRVHSDKAHRRTVKNADILQRNAGTADGGKRIFVAYLVCEGKVCTSPQSVGNLPDKATVLSP